MGFYNLRPESIGGFQPVDPGTMLTSDGGNIASVISRIGNRAPQIKKRIEEYLGSAVPGIVGVGHSSLGSHEMLEFMQLARGSAQPKTFSADSM